MPLWKVYHPAGAYTAQDKKDLSERITGIVNSDLKLIQFSTKQRFKTDTPPLRSHTTYAFDAVSRLLFTIPAAR